MDATHNKDDSSDDSVTIDTIRKLFTRGETKLSPSLLLFCREARIDPQAALRCEEVEIGSDTKSSKIPTLRTQLMKAFELAASLGDDVAEQFVKDTIESIPKIMQKKPD